MQTKFNDVFIISDMFGNKNKLLFSFKCVKNAIKTITMHCVWSVFNVILVISKIIMKIILYTNLLNIDEVINN